MINIEEPIDIGKPWLITKKNGTLLIDDTGNRLTAEYIYSKKGKERIDLLMWVFNYYRKKGFPYPDIDDLTLKQSYARLVRKNPNEVYVNNNIKNSGSLGLDICRYFTKELYFNAKCGKKAKSCLDIFKNDELLIKVLKNRMGWNTTKEGGEERNYIFSIDDKMIIQGMRSSGLSLNISQFRPIISKFLCGKYSKFRILDYSAGWGARALGAISLNMDYVGIDPLTSNNINNLLNYYNSNSFVINGCSEDEHIYNNLGKFDFIFSSPPYFNQEIYSSDITQNYNRYTNYKDWLKYYWKKTVINCINVLNSDGIFSLIMLDKVNKYEIAKDMINICYNNGLRIFKDIPIITCKSHLTNKVNTNKVKKNTEKIYLFRRK